MEGYGLGAGARPSEAREHGCQVLAGVARGTLGNDFGRALCDDLPARLTAFRAEINDPIRRLDHVQIMLDDQQSVARGAELEEDFQQLGDVVEVQAGGRLIQNVERAAGRLAAQLGGEFHALRFAAAQRRGRLAQTNIAEADLRQRGQWVANLRHGAEERDGLIHRHVQHVGDVLAFVIDLQRLAVVAAPIAGLARHVHRRQEVHLDLDQAVALAFLAATAFDVEAEAPRAVAANLGRGQAREEVPDMVEHAGIGRWVAARGAANGRLINDDHLVEILEALEGTVQARALFGAEELPHQCPAQYVVHERALAGAADAGDAGERAERNAGVDVLKVVLARAEDLKPAPVRGRLYALTGDRDGELPPQILGGKRMRMSEDFLQRARGDQFTRSEEHT